VPRQQPPIFAARQPSGFVVPRRTTGRRYSAAIAHGLKRGRLAKAAGHARHMIKLTETHEEITPYLWVHPDEER
jgi:hypothetical protein